jgi:hypothetical protein
VAEFLQWLEASALGAAIRGSGVWTYAIVNLGHILGIATLFGSIAVLDLRLLGCWRRVSIAAVAAVVTPVAAAGFGIAIATGIGLLATNATEYVGNPFLLIKFSAIGLGLVNVAVVGRTRMWRERAVREPTRVERRYLALFAGVSLASWLTAIAAGRLIAYW